MIIRREILNEIREHLSAKEITIIIGPRQVGKTTLMRSLLSELQVKNEKVLFLNIDIEKDKRFFESQELLLNKIKLEIGDSGYVFIDEIQRKENAGLFLKGIYDTNLSYKFIVSGSGSLELKEKIQESLAGRKRFFELLPVTFKEFINYNTGYKYQDKLADFFNLEIEKTKILLLEYLCFGGYPRIVTEEKINEKKKILDEIFRSYIEKDIVYLLNIDRPDAFGALIKLLSYQAGRLINYTQLSSDIGIAVNTLKKYLWIAEKTYVLKSISPYFRNKKKELTKSRVTYFYDLGLRNYANGSFNLLNNPNELGFLFQNMIMSILEEKLKWGSGKLHFWRSKDKAEVDFVINQNNKLIPFEVKYSNIKNNTINRSMRSFIDKYKPEVAYIVNLSYTDKIKINKTDVKFIPFFKLFTSKFGMSLE